MYVSIKLLTILLIFFVLFLSSTAVIIEYIDRDVTQLKEEFENVESEQTVCTIKFDTDKFRQNKTRDVCWCVFE